MADVGDILDYPLSYRGFTLNEHRTAGGAYDGSKELTTALVERFDVSRVQLRDQREGRHLLSGADLGTATKVLRYVSVIGTLKDVSAAALEDRAAALMQAFDIEEAQYASPTSEGVLPLDFYCPTVNPPSGFSSPVHEMYRGRPSIYPQVFERRGGSLTRLFSVELVCPDPRRYVYGRTTVTPNSGNGWSVNAPNWNATVGAMTFGVITVVLSGAGHAAMTFTMNPNTAGTTTSIVLDLSGETAGTFSIIPEVGLVLKGGTVDLDTGAWSGGVRKTFTWASDPDTGWGVPRNGGTFSVTNRTNVTSVALDYHQARA